MDFIGPGLAGLITTLVSVGVPLVFLWVLLKGGLAMMQEKRREREEKARRER